MLKASDQRRIGGLSNLFSIMNPSQPVSVIRKSPDSPMATQSNFFFYFYFFLFFLFFVYFWCFFIFYFIIFLNIIYYSINY